MNDFEKDLEKYRDKLLQRKVLEVEARVYSPNCPFSYGIDVKFKNIRETFLYYSTGEFACRKSKLNINTH